jgi:hypothetical protein
MDKYRRQERRLYWLCGVIGVLLCVAIVRLFVQ